MLELCFQTAGLVCDVLSFLVSGLGRGSRGGVRFLGVVLCFFFFFLNVFSDQQLVTSAVLSRRLLVDSWVNLG